MRERNQSSRVSSVRWFAAATVLLSGAVALGMDDTHCRTKDGEAENCGGNVPGQDPYNTTVVGQRPPSMISKEAAPSVYVGGVDDDNGRGTGEERRNDNPGSAPTRKKSGCRHPIEVDSNGNVLRCGDLSATDKCSDGRSPDRVKDSGSGQIYYSCERTPPTNGGVKRTAGGIWNWFLEKTGAKERERKERQRCANGRPLPGDYCEENVGGPRG